MATRRARPARCNGGRQDSDVTGQLGMSHTILAERIGVTFQQVRKYEQGANRVGASRLPQIASVLGVSVGELFEIFPG